MTRLTALLALFAGSATAAAQSGHAPIPFQPGERMAYSVNYGVIPAGQLTIRVEGLETYQGRSAYHLVSEAQSNRAVSVLYQLASREESWLDAEGLYSLRYRRVSTENDKTREKDVRFDQQRHLRIEADGDTQPASPRAVDQLAMIYYMRTLPVAPGKIFLLRNQADPDDNPVRVSVLKRERIKVPAGAFDTYVVDIEVKTDSGVFKKGGENRVWVTADARRIPVKISSKVGIGSFTAELVEYSRGRPVDSAR
jgi:hypothetical protein